MWYDLLLQFLGTIPGVPIDLDMTRRTEVLRIVDQGRVR